MADESPRATGLTTPQRSFPVWDGVPGYEFESRRSARHPPAGPSRTASRGPDPQGGPFLYAPTAGNGLSQPAPVAPLAWPRDEQPRPGFEFDPDARTASLYGPEGAGPDGAGP